MKTEINGYKVGDKIKIIYMSGEPDYWGREGKITLIDDINQLHGTWGGLGIDLICDSIELLERGEA